MKPKQTDPMEEAYKQLDGTPSATGVSDAARGKVPQNDEEQFRENTEEKNERLYGEDEMHEAYVKIFEGLAMLMKK